MSPSEQTLTRRAMQARLHGADYIHRGSRTRKPYFLFNATALDVRVDVYTRRSPMEPVAYYMCELAVQESTDLFTADPPVQGSVYAGKLIISEEDGRQGLEEALITVAERVLWQRQQRGESIIHLVPIQTGLHDLVKRPEYAYCELAEPHPRFPFDGRREWFAKVLRHTLG
jgi:hypothetical protein